MISDFINLLFLERKSSCDICMDVLYTFSVSLIFPNYTIPLTLNMLLNKLVVTLYVSP